MRFLLALVAAALAPLALAAPAPAEAAVSEKRVIGNIHMCTEENWKGTCHNNFFPLDKCTHLTDVRGGFFNLKVGSAGADPGANCRLFDEEHTTCGGSGLAMVHNPGAADLFSRAGSPGKKAAYVKCWECTACV